MTTMYDVARLAGVSPATVSRHLRGQPVRDAERVQRAIDELGYFPNAVARTLKSGVTQTVGIVVPDVTNPFFASLVKGAESIAREQGYTLLLCNTDESSEREEALLADLIRRVDGVILAPATEQDETPLHVRQAGVPVVFVDRSLVHGDQFDSVLVDNQGGARQAARHLVSLGHQRIAMISGPLNTTPGRGRYEGFLAELTEHSIELPDEYLRAGDFRESSGHQETLRLLALPEPPTAIFTANNLMTIGALKALHDMRVRLPEQMSLIGFDDLELAPLLSPPVTVIDRPTVEQGVLAMRLLISKMREDSPGTPRHIELETRLCVRESCAPPPGPTGRREVKGHRGASR
jgi:LacI family transcriptional regulator